MACTAQLPQPTNPVWETHVHVGEYHAIFIVELTLCTTSLLYRGTNK